MHNVTSVLNRKLFCRYQLYKKVQELGGYIHPLLLIRHLRLNLSLRYDNVCKQSMWGLISGHLGCAFMFYVETAPACVCMCVRI